MKKYSFAFSLLVIFGINATCGNLLVNGDFEKSRGTRPDGWVYFSKNNYGALDSRTSASGRKSVKISVPEGSETICGFGQMNVKVNIPAQTPLLLSGWSKCQNITANKKSALRISSTVVFEDGKKGYLALYFPRSDTWTYKQREYKFPKKIVKIKTIYLQFYNTAGSIWYDDIFFGQAEKLKNQNNPEALIPKVIKPPILDGKLNDLCWKKAALLSGFTLYNREKFPKNKTEAFVCYDKKNLYVGLRCYDKILNPELQMRQKFKAAEKKRDGIVFKDDSIELFVDPGKGNYYQFAFNALGTRYDGKKLDKSWNSNWKVTCSINEKSWDAEVVIPFKKLGIDVVSPRKIGFNIARNEKADAETSTWARLKQGFHDPDNFGSLRMGISTLQLVPQKLLSSPTALGNKQLIFTIINPSAKKMKSKLIIKVSDTRGSKIYPVSVNLNPGESISKNVSIKIEKAGRCNYSYSLTNQGEIFYRSRIYNLDSNVILEAENKLFRTGNLKLLVNRKNVEKTFYLQKGINNITVECDKQVKDVRGYIQINGNDKYGTEQIRIDSKWKASVVNGKKVFRRRIEVGKTTTGPIDTESGLHINRGAFQPLPFTLFSPLEAKKLEIMIPDELDFIDFTDRNWSGSEIHAEKNGSTVIDGQKYNQYSAVIKAPERLKGKKYYFGTLLHLPDKTSASNLSFYYRTKGTGKSSDLLEIWNKRKIIPMTALKRNRPQKLHVQLWHSFVARYSPGQLKQMLKTFADAGFNTYIERFLCYNVTDCLQPLKSNDFRIIAELNSRSLTSRAYSKINPVKAKNFAGKTPSYVKYPTTYICNDGRRTLTDCIAKFVGKYPVDGYIFDMEFNPFRECDTSKVSRKAFAEFAGLKKIPSKIEIKQKHSGQWIDFMCREWAQVGQILRAGIRKIDKNRIFINYSAYQTQKNKEHYAIDWTKWHKAIDGAGMGYGRQSATVRKATFDALGNIPAYTGVLYHGGMPVDYYKNLKTRILRRISDGAKGITFFTWVRLEGRALKKINEACSILTRFENFFIKNNKVKSFTVSGGIHNDDVIMLKNGNDYLLLIFNERKTLKKGGIKLKLPYMPLISKDPDGKSFKASSLKISVQSNDVAVYYLKK
jgi:cellulose/xylan binding protein with CBM9 domain